MNIKYLVASPGRSGSIFVTRTIAMSMNYKAIFFPTQQSTNLNYPTVRHTHDATLQLPDNDIIVVQPHRQDLFSELVSAVIAETYNEWSDSSYTGNGTPFVCDVEMFTDKYVWHKKWHQAFEHYTVYSNRIHLCFEEFIGNSAMVCRALDIPVVDLTTKKSPYSENNILNIDQLRQEFAKLEQDQELQYAPINNFNWKNLKEL